MCGQECIAKTVSIIFNVHHLGLFAAFLPGAYFIFSMSTSFIITFFNITRWVKLAPHNIRKCISNRTLRNIANEALSFHNPFHLVDPGQDMIHLDIMMKVVP
jgi:hypothetical protein